MAVPEVLNSNHVRFVDEKKRRAYREPEPLEVLAVDEELALRVLNINHIRFVDEKEEEPTGSRKPYQPLTR